MSQYGSEEPASPQQEDDPQQYGEGEEEEGADETSGGDEGEEGAQGAMTKAGAPGAVAKSGQKGTMVTPGEGIHKHFTPGPHGHDVYASHLPHKSHQHAVESLGTVYEHGWDHSHTKSAGHIATFLFSAFARHMGFA